MLIIIDDLEEPLSGFNLIRLKTVPLEVTQDHHH